MQCQIDSCNWQRADSKMLHGLHSTTRTCVPYGPGISCTRPSRKDISSAMCVLQNEQSQPVQAISLLQKSACIFCKLIGCMHNSSVHLMQDVSTWGIKLEALKLVQTFVQFFSKLVGPYLPPLMAQAWQLFVGSQPVYQHLVINNAPDLDADQVLTQCPLAALCAAAAAHIKYLQGPHVWNAGSLQESKRSSTCSRSYAWSPESFPVHCSE